jgi:hypothetical protein
LTIDSSKAHRVDAGEFPRLSEFARGYLHQDLVPEHGSPLQAALAYVNDLPAAERKQAAAEAFRFRGITHDWRNAEVNQAVAALGGSWNFVAKSELDEVLHTIERGH